MERVQYNRGRMFVAGIFFVFCFAFFLYAFFYPETFAEVRRGRWMNTSFGHAVLVPVFIFSCAAMVWRACSIVFVDARAIEMTSGALRLNAFWGWREVRWSDIAEVSVKWFGKHPQLRVQTHSSGLLGPKKIHVPLGATQLPPGDVDRVVEAIVERAKGSPARSPSSTPASPAAPPAQSGFGRKGV